jgi:hypothetical protein
MANNQALLDLRVLGVELSKASTAPSEKTLHAVSAEIKRLADEIESLLTLHAPETATPSECPFCGSKIINGQCESYSA